MAYLRAIAFILTLTAAFIFVVPIQWLARRFDWRLQHRIQTLFSRAMCAIIGIRVEAHGRLAGGSPRFIVANHVSWTDVIALSSLYPLVFLAKREVASWPLLGFLAKLQGTIFIDRGKRLAIPVVNEALATLLRQGRDVVVFAEGTSSDGSKVLKFNASHFAALSRLSADDAQPRGVTLAPAAIVYTEPAAKSSNSSGQSDVGWYGDMTFVPHLWKLMRRGGARCHVLFGDAVNPASNDRKALAAATEESVCKLLTAGIAGNAPKADSAKSSTQD